MYSSFLLLLLLLFLVPKILLELIEAFVPESFVLMHPSCYLAEWFTSKRNEDFAALSPPFNQPRSFEQLQVFRHRV
jgi:hypothetical protein